MASLVPATLIAVALTASAARLSAGQEQAAPSFTIRQNVEEVLLYGTVLNRRGDVVRDLQRANFRVAEDGRPVQIVHFSPQVLPVSLSLVLDTSDSMAAEHTSLQNAAQALLRGSNTRDEASVTVFADDATIAQELTTSASAAERAAFASKTTSGGTALFDTIISSADHLTATAHFSKRVVVVITDGKDNASGADLQAAIKRVQRADGPVVYVIGLVYDLPGGDERRARKDLSRLAEETGGVALFPKSASEVTQAAEQVSRDIRQQYMIAFRPLAGGDEKAYHTVAVSASAKGAGSLTVRTRKGFSRGGGTSDH